MSKGLGRTQVFPVLVLIPFCYWTSATAWQLQLQMLDSNPDTSMTCCVIWGSFLTSLCLRVLFSNSSYLMSLT